jgi:DNA-binding NarL/FixJ family response regulator
MYEISTFRVHRPVELFAASVAVPTQPNLRETMTAQRVLIVEDNNATAEFISQQLTDGGLLPEVVRGGLEALRRVHTQSFALAIVDVDITSEPDGIETADWLRRLYGVPVVVFTMQADPGLQHRTASVGPVGCVSGPRLGELPGVAASVLSTVLARRPTGELAAERAFQDYGARAEAVPGSDRPPAVGQTGSPAMPAGFAALSGREWQIIRDLIDTPSAHAVAVKRQRSPHTVHNHLKSIFRKLQVHSVAELLSLMIRIGRHSPVI